MTTPQGQEILGISTTPNDPGIISGLREQIKSNAGLLFPHATSGVAQAAYDVVIMTAADSASTSYEAAVTYIAPGSWGFRAGAMVAKGQACDTVVAALYSLLHVLAAALEKYQGNVMKQSIERPVGIAGGVLDEAMVLGKSKKAWFGGEKK